MSKQSLSTELQAKIYQLMNEAEAKEPKIMEWNNDDSTYIIDGITKTFTLLKKGTDTELIDGIRRHILACKFRYKDDTVND